MNRRLFRQLLRLGLRLALLLPVAWGVGALLIDGPASRPLAIGAAAAFALLSLGLLFLVRKLRAGALAFGVLFAVLLAWWFSIEPRNDRDWLGDVARTTSATFDGDLVTLHDMRDCTYRSDTDFDCRWVDRTYDLSRLTGLDVFVSYWGPTLIAHTIMSWEFDDGRHLAISIETRKEKGEEYSALRGFYRQYELYYVVSDEHDLVGVRADVRDEDLYLYRLRTPVPRAKGILVAYLETINELDAQPRWYNAFTHNCTTTIFDHAARIVGHIPFDWRILANGKIDEMLYEQGIINTERPFAEVRAASAVSARARGASGAADFSARLRVGLPARPPWVP